MHNLRAWLEREQLKKTTKVYNLTRLYSYDSAISSFACDVWEQGEKNMMDKNGKILIVDDAKSNREILSEILNQYTDLEDQKKIAELFNTTLKISPLAEDRDKALNDIVRRVKEDSIEQQMNATNDILRWQDLIKEKANLAKLHISL